MSFFNRNNKGSASVARNRLLTVLLHDRVKLTPDMIERLKIELCDVIRRYLPSIDPATIDIAVTQTENNTDQLETRIPLGRVRNR
ncbi:MAG: cell division topological specificity factor MinE [Chloroflexales bacterium]|nr:cell division topological specificity factor MinE [Chloroflexales bacterium]